MDFIRRDSRADQKQFSLIMRVCHPDAKIPWCFMLSISSARQAVQTAMRIGKERMKGYAKKLNKSTSIDILCAQRPTQIRLDGCDKTSADTSALSRELKLTLHQTISCACVFWSSPDYHHHHHPHHWENENERRSQRWSTKGTRGEKKSQSVWRHWKLSLEEQQPVNDGRNERKDEGSWR